MDKTFTFNSIPKSVGEINPVVNDPHEMVALASLVLCNYENDPNATFDMINALKGPSPLSAYDKQFINDRLRGKGYKPRSYFQGATPQNNYTPNVPYTITVSDNPYSFQEENYGTLYVKSSGADSPRPIKVRKKASTGQWFLWEYLTLADIVAPVEDDPWA